MWKVFADYLAFRQFGAIVIEHGLLVCCVLASIQIRLNQYPDVLHDYDHPFLKAILIALTCQLFLHLRDVYDFGMTASMGQLWARLGQGILLAGVGLSVLFFFVPDLMVGRGILLINLGLTWAVLTVWHTLLRLYFGKRAPHSRILVLGTGHLGVEVVREILRHPERGIGVCGFLDDNPALIGSSVVNPKVLGSYKDVLRIASANNVDRIVVEVQDRRGHLPIGELLSLKTRGVAVEDATHDPNWCYTNKRCPSS